MQLFLLKYFCQFHTSSRHIDASIPSSAIVRASDLGKVADASAITTIGEFNRIQLFFGRKVSSAIAASFERYLLAVGANNFVLIGIGYQ